LVASVRLLLSGQRERYRLPSSFLGDLQLVPQLGVVPLGTEGVDELAQPGRIAVDPEDLERDPVGEGGEALVL